MTRFYKAAHKTLAFNTLQLIRVSALTTLDVPFDLKVSISVSIGSLHFKNNKKTRFTLEYN